MREFRIATRGSLLAMAQAQSIKRKLEEAGALVSIRVVETKGDRDRVHALQDIGGDGLFVRSIEKVLLEGAADIAVHSGKDLPYDLQEGLVIGGVPEAEEPFDCLVCPAAAEEGTLKRIGTGSPRRISQLKALFPEAVFVPIRGNVNTRINKIRRGEIDAVILAQAGMRRLMEQEKQRQEEAEESGKDSGIPAAKERADNGFSLDGMRVRVFTASELLPAACQGILALECRADDQETRDLLERISDPQARLRFELERAVFTGMKADCRTVLGASARIEGDDLTLRGMFAGKTAVATGKLADQDALVAQVISAIYVSQGDGVRHG